MIIFLIFKNCIEVRINCQKTPQAMSKKGSSWSETEDRLLESIVRQTQQDSGKPFHQAHKVNWNKVSAKVPGRTPGGCQARWNVWLDPTVDRSPWTPELDSRLLQLYNDKNCNSWSKRAKALAEGNLTTSGDPMRRSGADCCERYFFLKKNLGQALDSTLIGLTGLATTAPGAGAGAVARRVLEQSTNGDRPETEDVDADEEEKISAATAIPSESTSSALHNLMPVKDLAESSDSTASVPKTKRKHAAAKPSADLALPSEGTSTASKRERRPRASA